MDLLAEFEEASRPERPRCTVAALVMDLDAEGEAERVAKLKAALEAPHITSAAIAKVVEQWGHRIPQGAVQRHRRAVCSCGP